MRSVQKREEKEVEGQRGGVYYPSGSEGHDSNMTVN